MDARSNHVDPRVGESCGIFAIYRSPGAARLAYYALYALQHRGQESAGVVVSDGEKIRSRKGLGLLGEVISPSDFDSLPGHLAVGHVRYSTTGGSRRPQNIQPLVLEYSKGLLAVAHNGNLVNAREVRAESEARGSIFQTSTDSELIVHLLARPENLGLEHPLCRCLPQLRGSYSFAFLTRDSVTVARDPRGFRPLAMGRLGDAVVFASETCAFDLIGAAYERDVKPGEIVTVSERGAESRSIENSEGTRKAHCIFEHIYFARPDSVVFGETVHDVRVEFGRRLARDAPADADAVVPVPDSGRSPALGYARESGIAFDRGFIRNHYVGRTFIMPAEDPRGPSVDIKLNAVKSAVDGKRIVVVDDSIIRGTTSRRRVRLLREAGAREIHVRIAAPPCRFACFYGIDFPSPGELVASSRTAEEVRAFLEVESLSYQTVEGMLSAVARPGDYCAACFTGDYPEPLTEHVYKESLEGRVAGE
ncbi:MAG: amidophosphoribosyltransferase [Planctomycetota bacterium]